MTSICTDDIRGSIEQQLATKEYNLKKRKAAPKSKAKDTGGDEAAPQQQQDAYLVEDDDVWSIPSEDEGRGGSNGTFKAKKAKTDGGAAAAARQALKDARVRASKWRVEVVKAGKLINSLNSTCHSLGQMLTKVSKNEDKINSGLQQSLKQADEAVRALRSGYLFANVFLTRFNSGVTAHSFNSMPSQLSRLFLLPAV